MKYEYHHMGIPTTEIREDERYSPRFKMYTSGGSLPLRIQWHRFEEGSSLHHLIQTKMHVAFKVENLEEAIQGKELLLGPYEPIKYFHVAMFLEDGVLIELIETSLSESEIWDEKNHEDSLLYPS